MVYASYSQVCWQASPLDEREQWIKMFWKRRQAQPPVVSCFGKLPATGDFIRHNAAAPELTSFDGWLNSSLTLAKQTMGDTFAAAYESSVGLFIYRPDDAGDEEPVRGVIGVWAASRDSAGRSYPMVVATSYDYAQMVEVGAALPIAVWPFLVAAYDLVNNGRGLPVDEFVSRVAQLKPMPIEDPAVAQPYRDWLQHQSMKALWETGFSTVDQRFNVLHGVQASVEIFRGQERPQTNLAIRFPTGAGDTYAAAIWMDLTVRLAKWQRTVVNAFWTPLQYLLVHIGPPHVATFRELIASTGDAEHVTDLTKPMAADERTARQGLGPLAQLVDSTDTTVAAFLSSLLESA